MFGGMAGSQMGRPALYILPEIGHRFSPSVTPTMTMKSYLAFAVIGFLALFAPAAHAQSTNAKQSSVEWPGRKSDGSVLLPNMWSLKPAGRQVDLGDFPVNIAVHPKGRFAAILHCGHGPHEIVIVDVVQAALISRTKVEEAFYGLEFSRDGGRIYCSGAS